MLDKIKRAFARHKPSGAPSLRPRSRRALLLWRAGHRHRGIPHPVLGRQASSPLPPIARYYLAKELTAATRPPGHDRAHRSESVQHDRRGQGAQHQGARCVRGIRELCRAQAQPAGRIDLPARTDPARGEAHQPLRAYRPQPGCAHLQLLRPDREVLQETPAPLPRRTRRGAALLAEQRADRQRPHRDRRPPQARAPQRARDQRRHSLPVQSALPGRGIRAAVVLGARERHAVLAAGPHQAVQGHARDLGGHQHREAQPAALHGVRAAGPRVPRALRVAGQPADGVVRALRKPPSGPLGKRQRAICTSSA